MSARSPLVRSLPCIACQLEQVATQCGPSEEHHLNAGGHAGQKRLGDSYSISLGPWHHRGVPPNGMTASEATFIYGPSLARSSKLFRTTYGSDLELLAKTNELLEALV
jgi:hypothetical protein